MFDGKSLMIKLHSQFLAKFILNVFHKYVFKWQKYEQKDLKINEISDLHPDFPFPICQRTALVSFVSQIIGCLKLLIHLKI